MFGSFSAPGAEFLKLDFALNLLLVLMRVIIPVFADFTL